MFENSDWTEKTTKNNYPDFGR